MPGLRALYMSVSLAGQGFRLWLSLDARRHFIGDKDESTSAGAAFSGRLVSRMYGVCAGSMDCGALYALLVPSAFGGRKHDRVKLVLFIAWMARRVVFGRGTWHVPRHDIRDVRIPEEIQGDIRRIPLVCA